MKTLISIAFVLFFCCVVYSQSVGEVVDYKCNCFGQVWVNATVEAVRGDSVRVRFGNLDNQVATVKINSGLIRMKPKPEDPGVIEFRNRFAKSAGPYRRSLEQMAQFYDPQFLPQGGPVRPEEWQAVMSDFAALDSLCRTQYRGVADVQDPTYVRPGYIDYRFGTWCDMAAKRGEIEPRARAGMAKQLINLGYTEENLNFGFNEPDNPIRMETQQLIWERDKWRAEKVAWLKPKYAQYGTTVPADATAVAEKRADQLRDMVMRDAPNRSWKQPKFHDAAIESFMKAKFAAQYRGAQVLKIGLDYTTWVKRQSLTYVDSDEFFNYYKVSYNSYKRGSVLLKIPGRPFCQTQDWVVGQSGKGLVAVAVGGSGTFMNCE